MLNTYKNYLNEPKTLTIEQMESLHREILEEVGNDSEALEIYNELIDTAVIYANMRAKWLHMSREEKMDQDSLRTALHDSMIIHFNMLARLLRMQGHKAEWRDALGDENEDRFVRKTIGDFGCYIVFVNSICER